MRGYLDAIPGTNTVSGKIPIEPRTSARDGRHRHGPRNTRPWSPRTVLNVLYFIFYLDADITELPRETGTRVDLSTSLCPLSSGLSPRLIGAWVCPQAAGNRGQESTRTAWGRTCVRGKVCSQEGRERRRLSREAPARFQGTREAQPLPGRRSESCSRRPLITPQQPVHPAPVMSQSPPPSLSPASSSRVPRVPD